MLSRRSANALQDSQSAAWYWGAIAAVTCDAVLVVCLAAARLVIFHGASLLELGSWTASRGSAIIDTVMEPVRQRRYPMGSSGAIATALLVGASFGSFPVRVSFAGVPRAMMTACAQQCSTLRARRQCTLIMLCILGMAQLASLACTNWAAAYAAASVCVPAAIVFCRLFG